MVRREKVLSGLAGIGFSLSIALMLVGIIGVQVTSQTSLEQVMSAVMSGGGPDGQDPLATLYDQLNLYCQLFPTGTITQDDGGLPFAINCTDVAGLDLQGFKDYFVGTFSGMVWRGELPLEQLGGGDDGGLGFLWLFTARGNAMCFGLAALALLPLAGTGAAVLHLTPPGRRLRRFGVSLTGDGIGGLVVSAVVFALLPSMLPASAEGPNTGALLGLFSGPVYATLVLVLVAGLALLTIYLAQRYLAGRRDRGEPP